MTLSLLDREGPPFAPPDVRAVLGLDDGLGGGRRLLCRPCGRVITAESARIEVNGAHEHVRKNPSGFVFRIGCFRAAPGAVGWGGAVAERTWFPGHTWQIALCGGCAFHLGWAFQGPDTAPAPGADGFHGLIVDRLRLDPEGDRP